MSGGPASALPAKSRIAFKIAAKHKQRNRRIFLSGICQVSFFLRVIQTAQCQDASISECGNRSALLLRPSAFVDVPDLYVGVAQRIARGIQHVLVEAQNALARTGWRPR